MATSLKVIGTKRSIPLWFDSAVPRPDDCRNKQGSGAVPHEGRVRMRAARHQCCSPEIRTPIAALQLHIEDVLRSQSDAERMGALESALAGAWRTSKLAAQLLALGRISARSDAFQAHRLSLPALCCEAIGALEPLLERRSQSIGLDAEYDGQIWGETLATDASVAEPDRKRLGAWCCGR